MKDALYNNPLHGSLNVTGPMVPMGRPANVPNPFVFCYFHVIFFGTSPLIFSLFRVLFNYLHFLLDVLILAIDVLGWSMLDLDLVFNYKSIVMPL